MISTTMWSRSLGDEVGRVGNSAPSSPTEIDWDNLVIVVSAASEDRKLGGRGINQSSRSRPYGCI